MIECYCHTCIDGKLDEPTGLPISMIRFIVCPICGNKRCPKATNHEFECTSSNDVGQKGSIYENC